MRKVRLDQSCPLTATSTIVGEKRFLTIVEDEVTECAEGSEEEAGAVQQPSLFAVLPIAAQPLAKSAERLCICHRISCLFSSLA